MTKSDLIKLVLSEEEQKRYDPSLPQLWFDKCQDMQINPFWYIWLYKEGGIGGKPFNLLERFFEIYQDVPELVKAVNEHIDDAHEREEVWPDDVRKSERNVNNMSKDYAYMTLCLNSIKTRKNQSHGN